MLTSEKSIVQIGKYREKDAITNIEAESYTSIPNKKNISLISTKVLISLVNRYEAEQLKLLWGLGIHEQLELYQSYSL